MSQNQNPTSFNPRKEIKEKFIRKDFDVENWSRFIALTSNKNSLAKFHHSQ
jgi:hypothetical protein